MLYPVELPDQIPFSAPCNSCRGHKSGAKLMLFLRLSKQLRQKPHLFSVHKAAVKVSKIASLVLLIYNFNPPPQM